MKGAWMVAAGAIIAAGVAALAIPTDHKKERSAFVETPSMEEAARRMGIMLPSPARLIGTSAEEGMDSLVTMKLVTSKAGLESFLSANKVDPAGVREMRGLLAPDEGWWDPSKPQSLLVSQTEQPNGATLDIGYASLGGDEVVLYLKWFTK